MSSLAVSAGDPPPALVRTVRTIDRFTLSTAAVFCWLVVPLVAAMTYEVFSRYLFNRPTIWAYDVSYMLYGSHFMLGAAYTLYRGGHIRTDIFYQNWSPRTKGIVDATLYVLFFFPGIVLFFWMSLQEALHSLDIWEVSAASPWRPVMWPFKMMMPLALALLFLQGISEFLKSAYAAKTGRTL
ncbi:MAG: TRAP transporter small permease subunit [Geminicoccaceae bacterium]|nr:TRAP transporter small permease subunit [Geminicoccaceae bacterium]